MIFAGEYIHVKWYHAVTASAWFTYIGAGRNAGGCTVWYFYYFVDTILRCYITPSKMHPVGMWYWPDNMMLLYQPMLWLFFLYIAKCPLKKLTFYYWQLKARKRAFNWYTYSNTYLRFRETVPWRHCSTKSCPHYNQNQTVWTNKSERYLTHRVLYT